MLGRRELNSERSRAARQLAQDALVSFLHELGDFDPPLVVIGGLVPEVLTRNQQPPVPPHLGTTDVDVLIDFQVAPEANLQPMEDALVKLGFAADVKTGGWRWVSADRGAPIKLEFLCELENEQAGAVIRPTGCRQLGAANLRGTGYVRDDWVIEAVEGRLADGQMMTLDIRFAGLCGYILAKATALRERSLEKDCYDLAYVLLYNRLGGPAQAARALLAGKLGSRVAGLRTLWLEIADRFGAPDRSGAVGYATQAKLVDVGADVAQLRRDAVAAMDEFLGVLGVHR